MTRVPLISLVLLVGALLLPPAASAPADPDPNATPLIEEWERLSPEERAEKFRLYEERWKKLPKPERERRLKLWREKLKDLSGEEKDELLHRLRSLKHRADLEDLRRKNRHIRKIVRSILETAPEPLRERVGELEPKRRKALEYFAVGRLFEITREMVQRSLTERERAHLRSLPGRRRRKAVREILRNKILAALPEEERAGISKLPERQRAARLDELLRQVSEARSHAARERVVEEVRALLDRGPEELERQARLHRLRRTLRDLGVRDPSLVRAMAGLPPPQLRALLDEIRQARVPAERRAVIETIRAKLSK